MELTEIRSSLFGYNKADVIQYISELNETHQAQLDNKNFEYQTLKDNNDATIKNLEENADAQKSDIADLQQQLADTAARLAETASSLNEYKELYDALNAEAEELRSKSDVISTAIINAERCADMLVNDARNNADNIMQQAQEMVDLEKQRLLKAKGCVSDIRAQLANVMLQINSALGSAEQDIDIKIKSVEKKPEVVNK